jgi:hypothetical protein
MSAPVERYYENITKVAGVSHDNPDHTQRQAIITHRRNSDDAQRGWIVPAVVIGFCIALAGVFIFVVMHRLTHQYKAHAKSAVSRPLIPTSPR